jgi:hypothetical protein
VLALPLLRILAMLAGMAWVALAPTAYLQWGGVHGALLGFFLYSVAVIVALWYRPGAMLRLNVWVLGADVVFALLVIHFTGGAESPFFLALLLIAGLQSYYYGMTRGVTVAQASGAAYLAVGWPTIGEEECCRFRRRHEVASLARTRWNREDRARREPHHTLGRAAQEGVAHARALVSAEDDEADALVSRVADDLMRYAARQEGGFQRAAC